MTIACKMRKDDHGMFYETMPVTISTAPDVNVIVPDPSTITNDNVYTADGSPPIGTYKWSKPVVTYAIYIAPNQVIKEITHIHDFSVAVNSAFESFHIWCDPNKIRFQLIPYDARAPADITIKVDANDQIFLQDKSVMAYCHYPNTTLTGEFTCVINPAYVWSLDGKFNFANNINQTLRHELGHGIGCVHTIDPKDIMYPFYHNDVVPTNEDILQYQTMYGKRIIPNWFIKAWYENDAKLYQFSQN